MSGPASRSCLSAPRSRSHLTGTCPGCEPSCTVISADRHPVERPLVARCPLAVVVRPWPYFPLAPSSVGRSWLMPRCGSGRYRVRFQLPEPQNVGHPDERECLARCPPLPTSTALRRWGVAATSGTILDVALSCQEWWGQARAERGAKGGQSGSRVRTSGLTGHVCKHPAPLVPRWGQSRAVRASCLAAACWVPVYMSVRAGCVHGAPAAGAFAVHPHRSPLSVQRSARATGDAGFAVKSRRGLRPGRHAGRQGFGA